jgi:cytochrome c oxidase subunit II
MSNCFKRVTGPAVIKGARLAPGIILSLFSTLAAADYAINLPPPATSIAHEIFGLHNLIFMVCVAIFVVVFGAMFYSIFAHRKSRGHKPAKFHESTTIEIIWTAIPFFILVAMAIPSTATLLRMEDTKTDADLVIKITGHQWKWQYEYPDQDISFFSTLATPRDQIENKSPKGEHYLLEVDKPMVVPVGKKVRFLLTANDVIHSWWMPAFGVKKDAIPGFINEAWTRVDEPGTYRGQCAELCGKDHGFMPIVVEAVSEDEFAKWVSVQKAQMVASAADAGKTWSKDELMARGGKAYNANCLACHGAEGKGMPNMFPAMAGSAIANGPVDAHIKTVLHGRASGKFPAQMPAFAAQLNDADVAAIITYERNSFGNKTGDVIQPSQVKALR